MIKQLLKSPTFLFVFWSLGICSLQAQTSTEQITENLRNESRVKSFIMDPVRETPSQIIMDHSAAPLSVFDTPGFLTEILGLAGETTFILEATTSNNGFDVHRFQQYYNGIKVEHGVFKSISRKDIVLAYTAEYYNLPASLNTTASLSEDAALNKALDHIGALTYAWETLDLLEDSPEKTAAYAELYPQGELVLVDNYATSSIDISLAYKFDIYAAEPLSRDDVYVDANTGEILLVDAIIKHANGIHTKNDVVKTLKSTKNPIPVQVFLTGSGDTRYAGNRNFDTSKDENGNFILKGITPSGIENETFSYEGKGGLPLSIPALTMFAEPIADGDSSLLHSETADNNWTAAEHRKDNFSTTNIYPIFNETNNDDVALDAHWGAEVVLDYWKNVHNRFSYDNKGTKVLNFVHYGDAYDNAFWNGSAMTYGDGSYQGGTNPNGSFAPLTSMDVCAHEIGHGVCEFTANLVYQRESGAMNEGFSDIWAAAVENYVLTHIDGSLNYDPWGIGEQIDERDGGLQPGEAGARALRWMDDPKAAGDPDSYGGQNWIEPECGTPTLANDQCGVHTNSGVLNKWYYFMVAGSGQNFSPGFQKQSADDQVTDAGNSYTVVGLGFEKSSQIAYIAETMLSPNAKFADMRATSILVAQTLYGIGSHEEQQTTNAWHAVDIGDAYNTGEPNTITFNNKNIQIYNEANLVNGCEDFNTYSIAIQGVEVSPSASISLSLAGSTATLGEDFDLSTQNLTFNGSEIKHIEVTVYDDAVIEGSESIVLSFVYNGEFHKQEFGISDNDFAPRTGKETFDLLPTEEFSVSGIPAGWSIVSATEGVNTWKTNGNLTAAGKAYVTDGTTDTPYYDQLSGSNTILRSPLINAAGASDITVSFNWEAGGETDPDPSILYDYGEFVFSLDGVNYTSVEKFVGDAAGVAPASGLFSLLLSELDGKSFYLGWRWFNDTLVGTEFSFTIDNVKITALPAGIETQANDQATATVHTGSTVYFLSETDQALIAKIENASEDLGCVTLAVIDEGNSFQTFSNISTARPSKAFSISATNENAPYDITLYFTDDELAAFDVPAELIPIKVDSQNIDDANDRQGNFQLNGVLTEVNAADGFRAFTGTFKGSGTLSTVKDFDYCIAAPSPWKTADIGITNTAGDLCYMDGTFEVTAAGTGISGKSDAFHFTYQELSGDMEIIARVTGLQRTTGSAKAAVMIRETLQADSKFAMTTMSTGLTGATTGFQYRKSTGGTITGTPQASAIPQYIRIVRNGKDVSSYVSSTNGNWQLMGTFKFNTTSDLFLGLAVTSGESGNTTVATFEEVSVTGTPQTQETQMLVSEEPDSTAKQDKTQLTLYPNPAVNNLNVEIEDHTIRQIAIYDVSGKLMKTYNFKSVNNKESIDVSGLYQGMYVLKLQTGTGQFFSEQFLKE
ncbi:T9SS type A sorting domain-containing protein [Antarcticibacterium arcticum]|uniref:T9SS type A sorting domain-containing protein n=1 Tax=Antarcticibacterium arcticum TaxID=2585771 RepID=A0A5B8YQQ7_9FLAO|nr:M4 family metallopeptidase [Antarcticibacterium arcticum]QED38776.1 T9SS type A sorting domain-containing protein [Antarcticibacterium arcticum]